MPVAAGPGGAAGAREGHSARAVPCDFAETNEEPIHGSTPPARRQRYAAAPQGKAGFLVLQQCLSFMPNAALSQYQLNTSLAVSARRVGARTKRLFLHAALAAPDSPSVLDVCRLLGSPANETLLAASVSAAADLAILPSLILILILLEVAVVVVHC